MPTPLPSPEHTDLEPPDDDEVQFISRGLKSACEPETGLTELQNVALMAVTKAMTGVDVDFDDLEPITAAAWVHVPADYGTRVESELEVFAFIARASDDPTAFALLAMVLSLFPSGNLPGAAGIFEADPGHLAESGMPARHATRCDGAVAAS